jgi:uncharacterized membrane protein
MKKLLTKLIFTIYLLSAVILPQTASADNEIQQVDQISVQPKDAVYEGVITDIDVSTQTLEFGPLLTTYHFSVRLTTGPLSGKTVTANMTGYAQELVVNYNIGDRVLVTSTAGFQGQDEFYITDHIRYPALGWLLILFIAAVVAVARLWGARSLLGLAFSFAVIFWFILPQILAGKDPVITAIIGGVIIMTITFYLSHGFNRKTHIALVSTALTLVITGILAKTFVELTRLTGYASEEALFLQSAQLPAINIRGLLLAGIMVGVLGVLDDITISQAAVVQAIKNTKPGIKTGELFVTAMKVGHDHIASLVNTLVLVYTGSALPLLLLFTESHRGFLEIVNYEIISEEIVRTLVGSLGLIVAVPITTLLASRFIKAEKQT